MSAEQDGRAASRLQHVLSSDGCKKPDRCGCRDRNCLIGRSVAALRDKGVISSIFDGTPPAGSGDARKVYTLLRGALLVGGRWSSHLARGPR